MNVTSIEPKEVHVNTITEMGLDSLLTIAAVHQHPLYFCSGKLFSFEPYAQTEWQHENASQGIHYFYSITYSHITLENYEETMTHKPTGTVVPIVDLREHSFWNLAFKEIL